MRTPLVAVLGLVLALAGCSQRTLKSAGSECVATSECQEGLTCDFGANPPVCAETQSGGGELDAAPAGDGGVDGAVMPADAAPADADAGVDAS